MKNKRGAIRSESIGKENFLASGVQVLFSSDFVIFGGYDDCIVTIPVGGSFNET